MRISLSGTFSTGKTTLTKAIHEALSERYPGEVDVIHEVARGVIAKGFQLDRGATVGSYANYILAQLRAEREATAKYVVSDRSLLDLIPYIRLNADDRIPDYFAEMLEEVVWCESRYFDAYCYLPVEFPMERDDVRPADEAYRQQIDNLFREILTEYRVTYVTVTGTVWERTRIATDLIGRS